MTWRQQMRPNLCSHAVRVAWVLFLGELGQAIAHVLSPAPLDAVSDRVPKSFPFLGHPSRDASQVVTLNALFGGKSLLNQKK